MENMSEASVIDKQYINHISNEITNVLVDAAEKTCGTYYYNSNSKDNRQNKNNKQWFNNECKTARGTYHKCRKKYNMVKNNENKSDMLNANKAYKR